MSECVHAGRPVRVGWGSPIKEPDVEGHVRKDEPVPYALQRFSPRLPFLGFFIISSLLESFAKNREESLSNDTIVSKCYHCQCNIGVS